MRRWTGVPLTVTLALGLLLGSAGLRPSGVAAAQVSTWVTIASKNPASGCLVDVSVEAQSTSGEALSAAEVLLGLVIDGELYTIDRGITAENGVVFLALDTGGAPTGGYAQIDVNIGGAYVGSAPIDVTSSGSCAENSTMWTATKSIDVQRAAVAANTAVEPASGSFVWVPSYSQQRNLSCEYASLTIATAAFGEGVSEYEFDNRVGWSSNPHWGFRGNITGAWGNTTDYGVYAEPLVAPLADFGFNGEVFYGQGDPSALRARLDAGRPTLVWIALWGDLREVQYTDDGSRFSMTPGIHVVVAYGYDEGGVYVSDPAVGAKRYYDWGTFSSMWSVLDGMALAVSPM